MLLILDRFNFSDLHLCTTRNFFLIINFRLPIYNVRFWSKITGGRDSVRQLGVTSSSLHILCSGEACKPWRQRKSQIKHRRPNSRARELLLILFIHTLFFSSRHISSLSTDASPILLQRRSSCKSLELLNIIFVCSVSGMLTFSGAS